MNKFLLIGVAVAAAWLYFKQSPKAEQSAQPAEPIIEATAPPAASPVFQCQGKQHCSQMTSCEEARFYLRSCPGVKIDGDGDGIPCEVPPLQCS
ncbi:excalibur calcium-binding domain-containing protein [Cupriavidus basilensis]|uniref:excalibur calcium-binding domain-containing protein n=1 Tax=Cupriavidus TaxID=106589 RepID=UPI0009DCB32E|nr:MULTISPECIES: excalibur calcium-binding domain-containing protein [Cupriavidus]MDF3881048.1 excalibur calcium-binding domain-containing protein [Cupriavidus basilensis]